MSIEQAYDLFSTGKVVEGFEQDEVVKSFVDLFNCTEEKALAYATTKKIVRKKIDKATGDTYSQKLKSIGLDVHLMPRTPPEEEALAANSGLSLIPVETNDAPGSAPAGSPPAQANASITPNSTPTNATSTSATNSTTSNTTAVDRDPGARKASSRDTDNDDSPFLKAITGPVIGAVIGALLWATILNGISYELGLIALVVGAIVGFGAKLTGFNGPTAAIVCALLVAGSIFGGKYLGYSWVLDGYNDYDTYVDQDVIDEAAEWGDVYKAEAAMLQEFVHTDTSLGEFMLENDYAYTNTPEQSELDDFKQYTIPMIMAYDNYSAANPEPTYRKLHAAWSVDSGGVSVTDAIKAGLGPLDLLFLLMGMAGAFRMVSDEE